MSHGQKLPPSRGSGRAEGHGPAGGREPHLHISQPRTWSAERMGGCRFQNVDVY